MPDADKESIIDRKSLVSSSVGGCEAGQFSAFNQVQARVYEKSRYENIPVLLFEQYQP